MYLQSTYVRQTYHLTNSKYILLSMINYKRIHTARYVLPYYMIKANKLKIEICWSVLHSVQHCSDLALQNTIKEVPKTMVNLLKVGYDLQVIIIIIMNLYSASSISQHTTLSSKMFHKLILGSLVTPILWTYWYNQAQWTLTTATHTTLIN